MQQQVDYPGLSSRYYPGSVLEGLKNITKTSDLSVSGPKFEPKILRILVESIIAWSIAQAVSRWLPTAAARVQTRVWSCGILWWTKVALGRFSPRISVSPVNLHSICFSTIIFTITRDWHNRPEVASQTKWKNKKIIAWFNLCSNNLLLLCCINVSNFIIRLMATDEMKLVYLF
jgi:hypothetical protein